MITNLSGDRIQFHVSNEYVYPYDYHLQHAARVLLVCKCYINATLHIILCLLLKAHDVVINNGYNFYVIHFAIASQEDQRFA